MPREKENNMAISNWFKSSVQAPALSPLEKAKAANPQVAAALLAEEQELAKTKEMSLLLEERNRLKDERLVVKVATVAAIDKFADLYEKEEEIDILLADKLSKWGF